MTSSPVIDEINSIEFIPILIDILNIINSSQSNVKNFNNLAGKLRIKLIKFKQLIESIKDIDQTINDRKLQIDNINHQILKKYQLLNNFVGLINEKLNLNLDNDNNNEVKIETKEINSVNTNTKSSIESNNDYNIINIEEYLIFDNSDIDLNDLLEINNSKSIEEIKIYENILKKKELELTNKQKTNVNTMNTNTNIESKIESSNPGETINDDNDTKLNSNNNDNNDIMDLDNDYMFMNGDLNMEDPGFDNNTNNNNSNNNANNNDNNNNNNVKKLEETGNDEFLPLGDFSNDEDNELNLDDFNLGEGTSSNVANEFGNFDDFGFDINF